MCGNAALRWLDDVPSLLHPVQLGQNFPLLVQDLLVAYPRRPTKGWKSILAAVADY